MNAAADDSFEDAIAQARNGDVSALWETAEALRPYMRRVAAAILAGRLAGKADASDVVQQGLLASVERLDQFRGSSKEEWQKWLVAIVRNEARNLLRYWHQDKRQVAKEDAVVGSRAVQTDPNAPERRLPGLGATPSHRVAAREEASRLLETLDRLPAGQREILRLRHFEGLSHAEIAARLDLSPDAVRQKWVRALRGLRRQIDG